MKNTFSLDQASTLLRIDLQTWAQSAQTWQGSATLKDFPRLLEEIEYTFEQIDDLSDQETQNQILAHAAHAIHWSARSENRLVLGSSKQLWLFLEIKTQFPVKCQRCLTPMIEKMAMARWFRFVESEEIAIEEDSDCEEDLLVFTKEFNLLELIEDELLMDLPIMPMHEKCPNDADLSLSVQDEDFEKAQSARPNPFAVLEKLKDTK